jgi:hypothetical protein
MSFRESHDAQLAAAPNVRTEARFRSAWSAKIQPKLLGTACALVLWGLLVAGLWPFHTPKNEVSWLSQGNGLLFGKYGSIVSAGTFKANRLGEERSCSLEIWLEPSRVDTSGTILAFYWPESRVVPFALRQSLGDLVLWRRNQDQPAKKASIYVDDVLNHLKPVFFTITSGKTGASIYADGTLVKKSRRFTFSDQDLTGQLIVGNAPATTHNWPGQVKALAIYHRELSAAEVAQHFADKTKGKQADLFNSEVVVASYLFNEGHGNVVHNQVDPSTDFFIPKRFFVLHEQLLERPWDEFRSDRHYWEDVGINIAGFIPLGFFFRAYFSPIGKIKRATWLTIALGLSVSLTIEVLQAFLPTRDSGVTDLITNTFGSALGAILCAWSMKHDWFVRTMFPPAASACASIAPGYRQ